MSRFTMLVLFALGCFSSLSGQQAEPTPPKFSQEAMGSLEFDTTAGRSRIGAGSFVILKETGRCYILTVRHLLGPNKDFSQAVAPEDVPKTVKGIQFDSAAYPVTTAPDQTLVLADTPPTAGDTIWIVGKVRGGAPEGEIAHSAKVTNSSGLWLRAAWDNDNIDSYGASGAPVLNAAGEMVGIESGHSMWNGHKVAFIIPAAMILAAIKSSEQSSTSQ
jgi:hypothetical protein